MVRADLARGLALVLALALDLALAFAVAWRCGRDARRDRVKRDSVLRPKAAKMLSRCRGEEEKKKKTPSDSKVVCCTESKKGVSQSNAVDMSESE